MIYGDLHILDILFFAAVAAFLFYRLRGVLGKKTGFEKTTNHEKPIPNTDENFKTTKPKTQMPINLDENISELKKAYEAIPNFNHEKFLDGAKIAFETIIGYYNTGNKNGLKQLITKDLYDDFSKSIDANPDKLETKEILTLEITAIEKVWVEEKKIFITVVFLSKQTGGAEKTETTKKDHWTFEKNIHNRAPNWFLSAT